MKRKAFANILYYSLIQSYLIYGILTWGGTTKENLSHLSTIPNKTLRSITCSPRRSNLTKLYKKCELLQLDKLYKLEVAKFEFRFHSNALPSQFTSIIMSTKSILITLGHQKTKICSYQEGSRA